MAASADHRSTSRGCGNAGTAGPPACQRCGSCCQVDFSAYVEPADLDRWAAEDRAEILEALARSQPVWAGDRLVSARQGLDLGPCTFLVVEGSTATCTIYPTRPRICRAFVPASSPICRLHRATPHQGEG
ncbi:MAG: YkgJ family cysteine cluster protein [Candidatus Latescibacterota bacterium]|jgi:Fe-S-cluster containining protein